jgi:hypothetical protein
MKFVRNSLRTPANKVNHAYKPSAPTYERIQEELLRPLPEGGGRTIQFIKILGDPASQVAVAKVGRVGIFLLVFPPETTLTDMTRELRSVRANRRHVPEVGCIFSLKREAELAMEYVWDSFVGPVFGLAPESDSQ